MIELLIVGAAVGGIGVGYTRVRRFVRERLRFVDGVQWPAAPLVAGVAAVIVASPIAWILPVVGGGTALLFGAGMGLAVRHGARDLCRTHASIPDSF